MPYIGQAPAPKVVTSSDLADDVVTADKIGDTAISGFSALGAEPADTDEFLISDAGTLKRMDYSYIKGGGTHTLLATTTASNSAQVDFTSGIDSTYRIYMVDIVDVRPATNDTTLNLRFFQGGTVDAGGVYDFVRDRVSTDSGLNNTAGTTEANQITLTFANSNVSNGSLNGRIFIYDPSNTAIDTYARGMLTYHVDGDKPLMMDVIKT